MCRAGRSNRERCLVLRFANVGILFENAKPYPGYLRERKLIASPKKSTTLPGSSNPRLVILLLFILCYKFFGFFLAIEPIAVIICPVC